MATTAAAFEARCLLRAARQASLATAAGGAPFVSLVTPATDAGLGVLLWLSSLAEHTRQLAAEPRCCLLFQGAATGANPQTTPRISITGTAQRLDDARLKARWLARHPYAAMYADFADFSLWRVQPEAALLVGGFARALRLRAAQFLPDSAAQALLAEAEQDVIQHMNQDHPAALGRIATRLGGAAGPWRLVALDQDGCDLADGQVCLRLAFSRPVSEIAALREELVGAARV